MAGLTLAVPDPSPSQKIHVVAAPCHIPSIKQKLWAASVANHLHTGISWEFSNTCGLWQTWQNPSTSKNKSTSALGRIGGITTIAGSGRYWGQRTTYTADTVPTPIWVRRCIQLWRLWTDFNGLTFVWDRLFWQTVNIAVCSDRATSFRCVRTIYI